MSGIASGVMSGVASEVMSGIANEVMRDDINAGVTAAPPETPSESIRPLRERQARPLMTAQMSVELRIASSEFPSESSEAERLERFADRLDSCAQAGNYRCGKVVCPRCQAKKAKANRRRLEKRLHHLPPTKTLSLVTGTVAAQGVREGHSVLSQTFARLRRTALWKNAFVGGEFHIEYKVSEPGSSAPWNIHFHGLFEQARGATPDVGAFARRWAELLNRLGHVGNMQVKSPVDLMTEFTALKLGDHS